MTVGELRHRITIESKVETPDGIGGFTAAWSTHKTAWARIETAMGNERKFGMRLEENISHVLTCRSKAVVGTTAEMRVVFSGRIFQVKSVVRLNEVDEWTRLLAIEGVGT